MEILRTGEIVVGYESLYSRDNELVAQPCLEFLEVVFQIRRRHHEHKRVVSLDNAVYVT